MRASQTTLVRRAVREGLIEPPEGDQYIRGLVSGVSWTDAGFPALHSTYEGLLADPELLENEVWQLFEIDLGGELAARQRGSGRTTRRPCTRSTRGATTAGSTP